MLAVHLLALPAHSAPTSWLHNIAQHCNIKLTGVSVSNTSEKGVLKQALQYTRGLHLYVYIWFIPEFCHGTKYGSAVHHTSHKMQMEKLHHVANAPWRKMTWHDVTMLFYITKLLKDLASLHGLILTRKARSIPGLNDFKIEVSPLDAFSIFKPVEAALVPDKKNIGSVSTMPRADLHDPYHKSSSSGSSSWSRSSLLPSIMGLPSRSVAMSISWNVELNLSYSCSTGKVMGSHKPTLSVTCYLSTPGRWSTCRSVPNVHVNIIFNSINFNYMYMYICCTYT